MNEDEYEQALDEALKDIEEDDIELPRHTVSEILEKEGWKQNNYWEPDEGVYFGTFINFNLDAIIVIVPEENKNE